MVSVIRENGDWPKACAAPKCPRLIKPDSEYFVIERMDDNRVVEGPYFICRDKCLIAWVIELPSDRAEEARRWGEETT